MGPSIYGDWGHCDQQWGASLQCLAQPMHAVGRLINISSFLLSSQDIRHKESQWGRCPSKLKVMVFFLIEVLIQNLESQPLCIAIFPIINNTFFPPRFL